VLAFVGLVLLSLQALLDLPTEAEVAAFVVGNFAGIVGGAGVGAAFQVLAPDHEQRIRLRPAFRRTFRTFEGLSVLRSTVRTSRIDLMRNPSGASATAQALFDVLEARLTEQLRSSDDAYLEWHDIDPEEAEALWADLQGRSGNQ
jgi:hypothetical protein